METPALIQRRDDRVLWLTMNRPDRRNALNMDLTDQLITAIQEADHDDDVAAVVVTGNGTAFCAGMDLREQRPRRRPPQSLFMLDRRKPLLAAVNGAAVGGGMELALTCDIVIASETARFGLPEVKRGLVAGGGGMWRLPRVIGQQAALRMLLTGDLVDAAEAHHLGLVADVVDAERLGAVVQDLARSIARGAPLAIEQTLRVARDAFELTGEQLLRSSRLAGDVVLHSADAAEGKAAFIERREPVWTGR